MGIEKLVNSIERAKHPLHSGRLAVEGIGHALEGRQSLLVRQIGAGLIDLVNPSVSILNPGNWNGPNKEAGVAQQANSGEPWQPSAQVTVVSVAVPGSLTRR